MDIRNDRRRGVAWQRQHERHEQQPRTRPKSVGGWRRSVEETDGTKLGAGRWASRAMPKPRATAPLESWAFGAEDAWRDGATPSTGIGSQRAWLLAWCSSGRGESNGLRLFRRLRSAGVNGISGFSRTNQETIADIRVRGDAPLVAKSIHPVLHTQAAHFFKIDQVSREQGGFVGEANRGDLEVQRAKAQPLTPERVEDGGGFVVVGKDVPSAQSLDAPLKSRIGLDLLRALRRPVQQCQPAPDDLLDGDDGCENLDPGGAAARVETCGELGTAIQFREMIGINDGEHRATACDSPWLSTWRRAASLRRRLGRWRPSQHF